MAITPTEITTEAQIYLTGSPINLRIRNINEDATIKSAVVELYIWAGNLNAPPATATRMLYSEKVSASDDYINFQIAEILASYISKPRFYWSQGATPPMIAGEGIFWQTKHQVTNVNGSVEMPYESLTNFATLGYRFDFEQIGTQTDGQPYNGLLPINYNRKYAESIKYYKREFDFTQPLSTATSENIIKSTEVTPSAINCQLGEKYVFAYINRHGLFDIFTPFGRKVKSTSLEAEYNPRLYRNPNNVVTAVDPQQRRAITATPQRVNINTGTLHELQVDQVEELVYSPLVYLIEFTGEKFEVEQVGITVDNTIITVDSTIYTVDSHTVTAQDVGIYSTFTQSPVICKSEEFTRKTRLNDKGRINYDLSFEITSDRINNTR